MAELTPTDAPNRDAGTRDLVEPRDKNYDIIKSNFVLDALLRRKHETG